MNLMEWEVGIPGKANVRRSRGFIFHGASFVRVFLAATDWVCDRRLGTAACLNW
jgi:hypothetical protein